MKAGCFHLFCQIPGYFSLQLFGNNAPLQRNALFRLNAATINARFSIQKLVINRVLYLIGKSRIIFIVFRFIKHLCGIGKYFGVHIEIDRRGQFLGRMWFNRHPVSSSPWGQSGRTGAIHIVYISLYIFITVCQQFMIAIKHINVPWNNSDSACPIQSIIRAISPASCRNYIGKYTIGLLLVSMVGKPFLINSDTVIIV